jgi:uncharacterized protein VirK/YbjX
MCTATFVGFELPEAAVALTNVRHGARASRFLHSKAMVANLSTLYVHRGGQIERIFAYWVVVYSV